MKGIAKILAGLLLLLVLLGIAAVFILPKIIDVEQYRPMIEEKVSEATGRPFSLGKDMDLSVFPWLGVSLSEVVLGNPQGFSTDGLVRVRSLDVRVKLQPLLSKKIEVGTVVLDGLTVWLEKKKDGNVNWQMAQATGRTDQESEKKGSGQSGAALPVESLSIDGLKVTDAAIVYIDEAAGLKKEISGLDLTVDRMTLEEPISFTLKSLIDAHPVEVKGSFGPIGTVPGKGEMTLDLTVTALKQLGVTIAGKLVDPAVNPKFNLDIEITPFSVRKLAAEFDQPLPVETADPNVLESLGVAFNIQGTPSAVTLSKGILTLDDTSISFGVHLADFSKPDIRFEIEGDSIDLDRYLPPAKEGAEQEDSTAEGASSGETTAGPAPDYSSARKLEVVGSFKMDSVSVKGAAMEDIQAKLTGKKGIFRLRPLSMNLYDGSMNLDATVDVSADTQKTTLDLQASGIQAGPLVQDFMNKDIIEGTMKMDVSVDLSGETPQAVKKSLNGDGTFVFENGAIIGIDIPGIVRNAKASLGLGEKVDERPKTDFAELSIPFTLTDGVFATTDTKMASPLLRVSVSGKADLNEETLDFRVDPKMVATLKGQGDTEERSGVRVPILITETFSKPKIRPDIKGLLEQDLDAETIKATVKEAGEKAKDIQKNLKDVQADKDGVTKLFDSLNRKSTSTDEGTGSISGTGEAGNTVKEQPSGTDGSGAGKKSELDEAAKSVFKALQKD